MMWVIRAGKNGVYHDVFVANRKAYLSWDGYRYDLSSIESMADCREIVKKEKKTSNRTSISNWASQLYLFVQAIEVGQYVLIPSRCSRTYTLARITGTYSYDDKASDPFCHFRTMEIVEEAIPREIFEQNTAYSLNAFRTIFKAKNEEEIMKTINKWKEEVR